MHTLHQLKIKIKRFFTNPLYWALAILIAMVFWLGTSLSPMNLLGNDLRVHLLAGVIETIFSLVIIDRIVRFRETRRSLQLRKIGLERLAQPLKVYLMFWYRCGALPKNPKSKLTIRSVITMDSFIAKIKEKNFGARDSTKSYYQRLREQRDQFRRDMSIILAVYITVFEGEEVEIIDYFLRSNGLDYQIEYGALAPVPENNFLFEEVIPSALIEYMDKLGQLVSIYNSVAEKPIDDANVWIPNRLSEYWTPAKEETSNFLSRMTPNMLKTVIFDENSEETEGAERNEAP